MGVVRSAGDECGVIAAVQIQVRVVEEPYLQRVHGAACGGYAARDGRFLPGLGRMRP